MEVTRGRGLERLLSRDGAEVVIVPTFGNYFRRARERAGLTLRDAAKRIGVSEDGLGKIERNDNYASLATMVRMADVYGVKVGDLLPHSGEAVDRSELAELVIILDSLPAGQRSAVLEGLVTHAKSIRDLLKK